MFAGEVLEGINENLHVWEILQLSFGNLCQVLTRLKCDNLAAASSQLDSGDTTPGANLQQCRLVGNTAHPDDVSHHLVRITGASRLIVVCERIERGVKQLLSSEHHDGHPFRCRVNRSLILTRSRGLLKSRRPPSVILVTIKPNLPSDSNIACFNEDSSKTVSELA